MLVRSGIILVKYWFSIMRQEQERRPETIRRPERPVSSCRTDTVT